MERAAKALRPDPNRPELTEKTWARGNNPRAKLSAPRAQPTETEAVGEIKAATDRRAATLAGGREREPENPTTGKSDTKDNTSTTLGDHIKNLSTFPYYSVYPCKRQQENNRTPLPSLSLSSLLTPSK